MDKRIYELVDGASQLQINFTGLGTVIDNSNLADAKFLKFSNLIKANRIVSTDSANNYSAISPKSFLASIATETESGIIKYASDQEILDLSGSNAIQSSQTDLIWDAISSVGQLSTQYNYAGGSVSTNFANINNIYYSSQREISHFNGYIKTFMIFDTGDEFYVVIGGGIKPILTGTIASISAYIYYDDEKLLLPLIGYASNFNNNLKLTFKNIGGNFIDPETFANIYFQVSFVTEL